MLDKLRIKSHTSNATRNSSQLSIEIIVYLRCVCMCVSGRERVFRVFLLKKDIRKSRNLLGKYICTLEYTVASQIISNLLYQQSYGIIFDPLFRIVFFFLLPYIYMIVRKLYCLNGNRCNNLINGDFIWMMRNRAEQEYERRILCTQNLFI